MADKKCEHCGLPNPDKNPYCFCDQPFDRAAASDDIVKRLRSGCHQFDGVMLGGVLHDKRCLEAADELEQLRDLLRRYREETPLGHQPHMITHEVDAALAAIRTHYQHGGDAYTDEALLAREILNLLRRVIN
jgi:hypothetical protein